MNNIEQVRLNLAGLDLNEAADAFRKSQTVTEREAARRNLAHKTTAMVRKALEEKNAKAKEEPKPEGRKAAEGEGKKEEKKEEKAAVPTA